MYFGVIVAGGSGRRLGAQIPKQFLRLGDKPVIMHTVNTFLACSKLDQIYIGVHPEWLDHMKDLIIRFVNETDRRRLHVVAGGAERNDTIMNVIHAIETEYATDQVHYIITQDAVRPFVSERLLQEHIEKVAKYDAVDTVIPAVDTIIVSKDGKNIDDIPDRKYLYQSQTPQSFNMSMLKDLFESLTSEEKAILTDACKICTVRHKSVHLVMGDPLNFKITTPTDFEMAGILIERRVEGEDEHA